MPGIRDLADLRTAVRQRADMEHSAFVSDDEVDQYIQDSYGELYDLIIENGGASHFVRPADTIATEAGTPHYRIYETGTTDAQIYKVVDVWLLEPTPVRLVPGDPQKGIIYALAGKTGRPREYSVTGPEINVTGADDMFRQMMFYPCPDGEYAIQVLYIPTPQLLTTAATHNFMGFTGWDEYIVVDAAMKCLEKEESDTRHLQLRKMQLTERIRHHAQTMEIRDGAAVHDVYPWAPLVDYDPNLTLYTS